MLECLCCVESNVWCLDPCFIASTLCPLLLYVLHMIAFSFAEGRMVAIPVRAAQLAAQGLLRVMWCPLSLCVVTSCNILSSRSVSHKGRFCQDTRILLSFSFPVCGSWHFLKERASLWEVKKTFSQPTAPRGSFFLLVSSVKLSMTAC